MQHEFLSKRINELNGKFNDLQASREHSDEVNLEKYKAIDRDVSHVNGTSWNHARNTDDHLHGIEEKLRHLEGSSQRNNLRIEGAKVEEADSEIWNQCKKK